MNQTKVIWYAVVAVAAASGCAPRVQRPSNLPSSVEHKYIVQVKDQHGRAVGDARLNITYADWATFWIDETAPNRINSALDTDSGGQAVGAVDVSLGRHWRGYYKPELEALLAKLPSTHGGKDIWGYLSEFEVRGTTGASKAIFGVDGSPSSETISVVLKVPDKWRQQGRHVYRYVAKDKTGELVAGATITASIVDLAGTRGQGIRIVESTREVQCETDLRGECQIEVPVRMGIHYASQYEKQPLALQLAPLDRDPTTEGHFGYVSGSSATGTSGAFFQSKAVTNYQASKDNPNEPATTTLTLPLAKDYYCPLLLEPAQASFARTLDTWTKAIKLRADVRKVELKTICRENFKGKQYIALSFAHELQFNEVRLNNYGIGVLVFDEAVRKLLDPIATASTSLAVDGYKLRIRTQKSNFVDKDKRPEFLTYDFYLPKTLVRQYKDADISGQKLIDGSIVLLDDERIDLVLK